MQRTTSAEVAALALAAVVEVVAAVVEAMEAVEVVELAVVELAVVAEVEVGGRARATCCSSMRRAATWRARCASRAAPARRRRCSTSAVWCASPHLTHTSTYALRCAALLCLTSHLRFAFCFALLCSASDLSLGPQPRHTSSARGLVPARGASRRLARLSQQTNERAATDSHPRRCCGRSPPSRPSTTRAWRIATCGPRTCSSTRADTSSSPTLASQRRSRGPGAAECARRVSA